MKCPNAALAVSAADRAVVAAGRVVVTVAMAATAPDVPSARGVTTPCNDQCALQFQAVARI